MYHTFHFEFHLHARKISLRRQNRIKFSHLLSGNDESEVRAFTVITSTSAVQFVESIIFLFFCFFFHFKIAYFQVLAMKPERTKWKLKR